MGANVPRFDNFQLKRSNLKVTGHQKPSEDNAHIASMFTSQPRHTRRNGSLGDAKWTLK